MLLNGYITEVSIAATKEALREFLDREVKLQKGMLNELSETDLTKKKKKKAIIANIDRQLNVCSWLLSDKNITRRKLNALTWFSIQLSIKLKSFIIS